MDCQEGAPGSGSRVGQPGWALPTRSRSSPAAIRKERDKQAESAAWRPTDLSREGQTLPLQGL